MVDMQNISIHEEKDCVHSQSYQYRWCFAMLMVPVIALLDLTISAFGVVNNVYVMYFDLTFIQVDWFTMVQISGMILGSAVLAIFIFINPIQFRRQLMVMTTCEVFASACFIYAYAKPITFPLIYIGQFSIGISSALSVTAVTTFAVNWCSKTEIGTALSIRPFSLGIGSILGYIIPSHLFVSPANYNNSMRNVSFTNKTDKNWFENTQKRFLIFSVPFLFFCVGILIAQFILIPKTQTQLTKSNDNNCKDTSKKYFRKLTFNSTKSFLLEIKIIIINRTQCLLVFINSIRVGLYYIVILFMSEILRRTFSKQLHATKSNQIASYILCLFQVGYIAGSLASGLIYDKFNKPNLQINISNALTLFAIVGILLGIYFKSVIILMCFSIFLGFMYMVSYSVYFVIVLEHTRPSNESLVLDIIQMESFFGGLLVGQTARFILNSCGGSAVFIFVGLLWLLLMVLSLFIKPKTNENMPLVQK